MTNYQTPEEMLDRWDKVECQCDPDVNYMCELCHDTQVVKDLIRQRDELRKCLVLLADSNNAGYEASQRAAYRLADKVRGAKSNEEGI